MTTPVGTPLPPTPTYTLIVIAKGNPSTLPVVSFWDFTSGTAANQARVFLEAEGFLCELVDDE